MSPQAVAKGMITNQELAKLFANLVLLSDTFPCHTKDAASKLGQLQKDPASKESIFLLATYCFDLERRFGYLFRALERISNYGIKPDKQLKKEINTDNEAINKPNILWERRAEVAFNAMVRTHAEVKRAQKRQMKRSKRR